MTTFAATANNRKLASLISDAERYLGGYVYGGTTVEIEAPSFCREQFRTTVYGYGAPYIPNKADLAFNKRVLASAPCGSKIHFHSTFSRGRSYECWVKVGPCKWTRVEWSKDAPDGSGRFWDAEGYREWGPDLEDAPDGAIEVTGTSACPVCGNWGAVVHLIDQDGHEWTETRCLACEDREVAG